MRRLSLRWMLLIPVLATIVIGFIAFAAAVDVSERTQRMAEIDLELSRAELTPMVPLGHAAHPPTTGPAESGEERSTPSPAPQSSALADEMLPVQLAINREGQVVAQQGGANPFSPSTLAELAAQASGAMLNVDAYRVVVSQEPDGVTRVTALPLSGYTAAIVSLRQTLAVGGIVILLLEAAMVWIVARRLVRPLAETASTVNRITRGELDTVIKPSGGSREISELTMGIGQMVDRLRAAIAEREQSTNEATRARDDMRRLLDDVSHEIRTPLTALKGYSDLYAQGMLGDSVALDRAMSRVGDESIRLNELVNAMLQLARDGVAASIPGGSVDLVGVAQNVVDDLRVAFPERRIEAHLDQARHTRVQGATGPIHQALLNLGANACRHTPPETTVTILATVADAAVTVHVIDHGPGVAVAESEKIFLPFYRADPSRHRADQDGAGLGLAVTQQIALDHSGSVTVHPTPGGGATFELTLPIAH